MGARRRGTARTDGWAAVLPCCRPVLPPRRWVLAPHSTEPLGRRQGGGAAGGGGAGGALATLAGPAWPPRVAGRG